MSRRRKSSLLEGLLGLVALLPWWFGTRVADGRGERQ